MTDKKVPAQPVQQQGPTGVVVVTIPAGQAMSGTLDCTSGDIQYVGMPDDWTPAYLTFQISLDGTKFFDVFDRNSSEIARNVDPGTIVEGQSLGVAKTYVRFRSGPRDQPVPQDADRQFTVLIA